MRRSVVAALAVVALLAGLALVGARAYRYVYEQVTPQRCTVVMGDGVTTLSPEQARNASIIVAAALEQGLGERAAVIALATAYQESGLRNLDYGDLDSVGLFQQRPSAGWGTVEQIMDPWYASAAFYDALVKIDGWETGDINDVAQQVQISAFPDAYRKHVEKATAVAAALLGSTEGGITCLSFADSPTPDAAQFERQLTALGDGVSAEVGDAAVTVAADDSALLWSAAAMAMANSYAGGVTEIVVVDRRWAHDDEAGWTDAAEPVSDGTARVTLG